MAEKKSGKTGAGEREELVIINNARTSGLVAESRVIKLAGI